MRSTTTPAITTVLMYHGIEGVVGAQSLADPHYAVHRTQFDRHLELFDQVKRVPSSVASLLGGSRTNAVALTFDDGHASDAWAAERLAARGGSADFFVNSSTVGLPGFVTWSVLREMVAAGMSIQSHGHRHRYLNELSADEVEYELVASKSILEDKLGQPVELFAPPGGRVTGDLSRAAARAGYSAICTSRVALWNQGATSDVPRLAVLHNTSDARLAKWVLQDSTEMFVRRARYGALESGKRLLGNAAYESIRRLLIKAPASRAAE